MNMPFRRILTALLAATVAAGCTSERAANDAQSDEQRVAELEQELAEARSELAAAGTSGGAREPDRTEAESAAPARPAPSAPQRPAAQPKGAAAGSSAASEAAKLRAERDTLVEQQRAVNAQQADTNAALQAQVDGLKPREVTVPAGTVLPVRTVSELTTKLSTGSTFDAVLEHDLALDGAVIAKAGSRAVGVVVASDPGGRVKGTASLTVAVRSLVGPRKNVIAVETDTYTSAAESTKKKDAVRTGVASGVGAIIGGIVGGGKGAAIGAGTGAAAGVGTSLATRGDAAAIPAETLIEFRLASPLTVAVQP